jgi:dihydropyrimidinase
MRLIRGGRVVTATDAFDADVLIDGESVVAVGTGFEADDVIDASGCLVMPGLVDNHTHLSMPFGGTWSCEDYNTGTASAAAGGTTSIVDFIIQYVGGSLADARAEWRGRADGAAHIDYGFHMAITDARPEVVAEMEECVAEGITSFKVFMAYKGALMVDDEQFITVLEQTGRTGGLVMVHCENGDAVVRYQKEAIQEGNTDPKFHAWSRPPEVEGEATGRAIRLAEWTKRPLFVVHVTCEDAVVEIQRARDRGLPIFGETCLQYLMLTVDELARQGFEGAKYVCSPPLREERHQEVLYKALRQGALQGISTDHCPFNYSEQKELGLGDFTKIPNGLPAIEHRLTLLYDRSVRNGHMSVVDLVRHTSWGPARIFGLDKKGAIGPGFDADIVVFDPEVKHTISAETHQMDVDYDPFEGWEVTGKPRFVLSRGDTVYEDGKIVSEPGHGRYVHRSIFEPSLPNREPVSV